MTTELATRRRTVALTISCICALAWVGTLFAASPATADTTGSAQTVTATDYDSDAANSPLPNLAVTVSQTDELIQQGITVSWTGGKKSTVPNQQTGGSDFLQIAQCWGDEPGSGGTRPDRTTCQYGGFNLPGDSRWSTRSDSAPIATEDSSYTAAGAGWWESTMTAVPFNSATGASVASVVAGKRVANAPDLNSNEFFTKFTTNEVSWAGSGADGAGSVSFELQTNQQSPGLGCGAPVTAADGTVSGKACWLVVIPRGESDAGETAITKSGLLWDTWKHHVAVRLNFKPSGLRCAIGAAERQLSGSELISGAVGQWQPQLCGEADGSVYSLLTGPESDAAAAANGTATAPLALTSRALTPDAGTDSLAYAPIALTGISLGFSIDHQADATNSSVPDKVSAKERQAFTTLKLTPRLLAKLLTASYTDALPNGADKSHISGVRNLTQDPDFLAINDPEWAYMRIVGPGVGDALMPLGRSNAARAVWEYITADAAAAAFLNGEADNVRAGDDGNSGMKVNPYYSTNAAVNPTGVGLELPRDDFPKADPVEFAGYANHAYADSVNLVTWRPYTSSLDTGAYLVLRGDPQVLGDWDALSVPPKYGKAARGLVGLQAVLGLTDTSAASKYQISQALLRNPAGEFVAPTNASLSAAAEAMTSEATQSQVLRFDQTSKKAKAAAGAYPLAMPVYAAANPAMSDASVRTDYAAFITSVVTTGQTPGTDDGQLPPGYAPLPSSWKTQALSSASAIKDGHWPAASASATPGATPSASATPQTSTSATPKASASATPRATSSSNPTKSAASSTPSASPTGSSPSAQATSASTVNGNATPADPQIGPLAAAIPGSAALGLLAAASMPVIAFLRRRKQ
jgi:hypothetical protein